MEIAAVIQGETLCAVRHGKVIITPPLQCIAALDAVFHLDATDKVEVVLFTHIASAAQHIAGEFDIDKPGQSVVFQPRLRILDAFRRGFEVDILVLILRHDRFPLRIQDQVVIGHDAGVVEIFSECVLPSHETIAVARGCGKLHFVPHRVVARGNTSLTAVQIECDCAARCVVEHFVSALLALVARIGVACDEHADREREAQHNQHRQP